MLSLGTDYISEQSLLVGPNHTQGTRNKLQYNVVTRQSIMIALFLTGNRIRYKTFERLAHSEHVHTGILYIIYNIQEIPQLHICAALGHADYSVKEL